MWPKPTRNQPRNMDDAPTGCFLGALRRRRPSIPSVSLATQLISSDEESIVDVAVATPMPAPITSEQRCGEREPAPSPTSTDTLPGYEECVDQTISHLTIGKNEELEREIEAAIEKISPALRELSLKIHADPELGNVEYHAHDLLTSYLAGLGFTVERHAYGIPTAFVAEFAVGTGGRRVGFCAEYDALPGVGHACGHNLIAVSGVAAAVAVKTALEKGRVQGRVVLFGTPAEESTGGKIALLRQNAFQSRVDVCMMLHPTPKDLIYLSALAIDGITVDYYGRASHAAAAPWEGINAVDAVVQAWNNISMLRQQIQPTDRIHGIITHGGDAANIIPARASAFFYARSLHRFQLEELKPRIEACFRAAAEATGCGVKMGWSERGFTYDPPLIDELVSLDFSRKMSPTMHTSAFTDVLVNTVLAERYQAYAERAGFTFEPRHMQEAYPFGSTDMGNVTYAVPGIHPCYKITDAANHTVEFAAAAATQEAHDVTMRAARAIAMTGIEVLQTQGLLERAKTEFEREKGRR